MSAAALPASADAGRRALEGQRDDGPVAAAIGAAAGGALPAPAIVALLAALLPGTAAVAATGDAASRGLVAGAVAWAVIAGGLASARPLTDALAWLVPPALRALEYGGLLWIAAVAGASSLPAAFALLCAIAYHHYDDVYGLRHRGTPLPRWVTAAGGGWDGRLLAACALLLAGALPAGFIALAIALACLFAGASIQQWRHVDRGQPPVHDDEEDEAD
jgi:hypothetical protein